MQLTEHLTCALRIFQRWRWQRRWQWQNYKKTKPKKETGDRPGMCCGMEPISFYVFITTRILFQVRVMLRTRREAFDDRGCEMVPSSVRNTHLLEAWRTGMPRRKQ